MRLLTGLALGVVLAAGALSAALSQTRTTAAGAPATAAAANRTTDFLKLMQQAADAAAKAKAAQARADAAKAEADKRAAEAAANTGAQAAQAEADRKAAEAKAVADRQAAAAAQAEADKRAADAKAKRAAGGRGIDWPAAIGGARASGGGEGLAPNLNRAEVDKTQVPILLPTDAKLMAGARIYSFGDYYTITADAPGVGVSLSGTTSVVPLPAGTPLKITPMGPEGVTVQRTVDGQLVSFARYGVLYTVEVRCDAPTDQRCADDNYVMGLAAKTTAVVLGAAARAAAGLGG